MKVRAVGLLGCAALAVSLLDAGSAEAHTRRRSYSAWTWSGTEGRVIARFDDKSVAELIFGPGLESGTMTRKSFELLTRLPPQLLKRGLEVTQGGQPCPLTLDGETSPRQGRWFVVRGRYQCPMPVGTHGVELRSSLLPGSSLDHVHFLRWRILAGGEPVDEGSTSLGLGNRDFRYAGDGGASSHPGIYAMMVQGVLHVLLGYDHLAFLLTLIFGSWFFRRGGARAAAEMLRLALGFTVGHSLTLGLAATSIVHVDEASVEFLIALSVAGLAFEALLRGRAGDATLRFMGAAALVALVLGTLVGAVDHSPLAVTGAAAFLACQAWMRTPGPWARASVATVFGLVHGFGFAGALSELEIGGPELLSGLLGFNLGVELGQWLVIGFVLVPLSFITFERARRPVFEWGCGAMLWLGLFWMAQRV